jgi:hypothetical protein
VLSPTSQALINSLTFRIRVRRCCTGISCCAWGLCLDREVSHSRSEPSVEGQAGSALSVHSLFCHSYLELFIIRFLGPCGGYIFVFEEASRFSKTIQRFSFPCLCLCPASCVLALTRLPKAAMSKAVSYRFVISQVLVHISVEVMFRNP